MMLHSATCFLKRNTNVPKSKSRLQLRSCWFDERMTYELVPREWNLRNDGDDAVGCSDSGVSSPLPSEDVDWRRSLRIQPTWPETNRVNQVVNETRRKMCNLIRVWRIFCCFCCLKWGSAAYFCLPFRGTAAPTWPTLEPPNLYGIGWPLRSSRQSHCQRSIFKLWIGWNRSAILIWTGTSTPFSGIEE